MVEIPNLPTAEAVRGVTVSADLPGISRARRVRVGHSRCTQGDVLVELDTRQERAQLASLEAQRDLARVNFGRMQQLVRRRGHLADASMTRPAARQKGDRGKCGGDPRRD